MRDEAHSLGKFAVDQTADFEETSK